LYLPMSPKPGANKAARGRRDAQNSQPASQNARYRLVIILAGIFTID
jgi:hypothetical protein